MNDKLDVDLNKLLWDDEGEGEGESFLYTDLGTCYIQHLQDGTFDAIFEPTGEKGNELPIGTDSDLDTLKKKCYDYLVQEKISVKVEELHETLTQAKEIIRSLGVSVSSTTKQLANFGERLRAAKVRRREAREKSAVKP